MLLENKVFALKYIEEKKRRDSTYIKIDQVSALCWVINPCLSVFPKSFTNRTYTQKGKPFRTQNGEGLSIETKRGRRGGACALYQEIPQTMHYLILTFALQGR